MILLIFIARVGARAVLLHYSTTFFKRREVTLRLTAAINPPFEHVSYHLVPMVQPNSYSTPRRDCPRCRVLNDRSSCFQQASNGARGRPGHRNVGWVGPNGLNLSYVSPRCAYCAVHRWRSVYTLVWEQYSYFYYFITRQKKHR